MDLSVMFQISYGLYVLTAKEQDKDNGCIINTVMQVTDTPLYVTIAVNKLNLTHDMIVRTGVFNLSVLDERVPFGQFRRFGFQSGREADKFAEYDDTARSGNGLYYLTDCANAYISGKVDRKSVV